MSEEETVLEIRKAMEAKISMRIAQDRILSLKQTKTEFIRQKIAASKVSSNKLAVISVDTSHFKILPDGAKSTLTSHIDFLDKEIDMLERRVDLLSKQFSTYPLWIRDTCANITVNP